MGYAAKLVVDNLISDLQNRPEDFRCNEYTLTDTKNNIEYWVANMFFNGGIWRPYKMNFGFIQGWCFHAAVRKWKAWRNLNP